MIIVKLMGGLGNQMFQYAAARHLAHMHSTSVKMDLSYLEANPEGAYTKRNYELGCFNLPQLFATESELAGYNFLRKYKVLRGLQRLFPKLPGAAYALEQRNEYAALLTFPKNTYVDGFWQSENYFKPIAAIIRADFTFKALPIGLNQLLANEITNSLSVGIHIRRTDYLKNPQVFQVHGVCDIQYYNKAIALISQKCPAAKLFVFSDDQVWAQENIKYNMTTTFVQHNKTTESFEDMRLLSLCKHTIIANSSFSWWAAWLNSYPEKIVIAPMKWFNDPDLNAKAIVPSEWIQIE